MDMFLHCQPSMQHNRDGPVYTAKQCHQHHLSYVQILLKSHESEEMIINILHSVTFNTECSLCTAGGQLTQGSLHRTLRFYPFYYLSYVKSIWTWPVIVQTGLTHWCLGVFHGIWSFTSLLQSDTALPEEILPDASPMEVMGNNVESSCTNIFQSFAKARTKFQQSETNLLTSSLV